MISTNRFLTSLLFSAYKEILAEKNAVVTFFTKLVLLLLKNVCEVCRIRRSDLLPDAVWCLDVF